MKTKTGNFNIFPLFLAAVLSAALGAHGGGNLVRNPGFEELDASGFPAGWRSHQNASPMVFRSADDERYAGEHSCLYFNETAGYYEFIEQVVPARPGGTYDFSITVKQTAREDVPDDDSATPNVFMEFLANGTYLGGSYGSGAMPLNSDWVKLAGRATIPPNATTVIVGFRAVPNGTNRALMWFDNCSVTEVVTMDDFCCTDQYRDTAAGGTVSVIQGLSAGALTRLAAGEAVLRMEVSAGDGPPVMTLAPSALQLDRARFAFDADGLSPGKYTLRAIYKAPEEGVEFASNGVFTKVERLPDYHAYVDEHRRLIVDGRPFFPLGMYFGQFSKEILAPYLVTKFNCLLAYGTPNDDSILDYLQDNGLKLFFCIKYNVSAQTHDAEATERCQADGLAMVDQWKHHPAILAWYVSDELDAEYLPDALLYRQKCEEHDPTRPTFLVHNNPGQMRLFARTADLVGTDPYPIPHAKPVRAYDWSKTAADNALGRKMLLQVPQVFCWGKYWLSYGKPKEECAACRRPTFKEMDAMSWMCIAGGANGLLYYSYFDLLERNQATEVLPRIPLEEHFGECKQVAERIMAHEKVLLSAGTPLNYSIVANDGGKVVFRSYELDGVTWLLAVNTSDTDTCIFQLETERPVTLKGTTLSTPPVEVDGKSVHATLAPLESVFLQLQ